jgi:hypothetical protein
MNMFLRKLAIVALCCTSLSACVVAPLGRPYGYGGYPHHWVQHGDRWYDDGSQSPRR